MNDKYFRLFFDVSKITVLTLVLGATIGTFGQEGSKSIKSEEYIDKRPQAAIRGGATGTSTQASRSNSQVSKTSGIRPGKKTQGVGPPNESRRAPVQPLVYVVDKNFPEGPPPSGLEFVRLGVTVWRLSPAQCPIPNCPMPQADSQGKGLMDTAAARIEDDSALSTGERVRLGLESLSHGTFVYIIDREQFADGTFGTPYLLFPTKNINGGKNWAQPGMQVQLPRAEGCFCVKSRNPQKPLIADNLIVIMSPTQLLDSAEIGEREIPLPAKLAGYLRLASQAKTYRGSLQGGNGLTPTPQEMLAGSKGLFDTAPVLTQTDLPPQNFYQSAVTRGSAAVFSFSLRYDAPGMR